MTHTYTTLPVFYRYLLAPLVALLLAVAPAALAQTTPGGGVGIGTTAPNAKAALEIVSSEKGLLIPRLTATERGNIAAPVPAGLLVYQTDGTQPGFWYYEATNGWTYLNPTGNGAGDNLGNHTATQAVKLNDNALTNNGTGGLRIDNEGKVGIGTSSPTALLHIAGTASGTGAGSGTNLATAAVASASSQYNASYSASRVNDGSPGEGSTWSAAEGAELPQWVQLDLGSSPAAVKQYQVYLGPYNYAAGAWQLQGSNDASAWATLHTVSTDQPQGQYNAYAVTNTTAYRYYRLLISRGIAGYMGTDVDIAEWRLMSETGTTSSTPAVAVRIDPGTLQLSSGAAVGSFSTDGTLAGNSDASVPTEKAVKTYVDAKVAAGGGTGTDSQTLSINGQDLSISGGNTITLPTGSGTGDNLGDHTAIEALKLQGNAITGTGADLGTTVGLGVRADGGLNIGQNAPRTNFLLGYQAGQSNTTGYQNHFVGYQAGQANTSGYSNHFVGYLAGYANTTGIYNQFSGYQAGYANTEGRFNYFSGAQAGYNNTTGSDNQFVGYTSGFDNTTGSYNSFSGSQSGFRNTTGSSNLFSGYYSGRENTTGSQNVFLGTYTGIYNLTGRNNVALGYNSGPTSSDLTNAIAIGANVQAIQSNTMVLGNGVKVGIGTSEPTQKLEVAGGNIRIATAGNGLFFPDGTFQTTAGTADNLGNHTATQNLNLQGNALIGTGADIGYTKGIGIRADGGLNIGQNSYRSVYLGYQAGAVNTGLDNVFSGYQAGFSNTSGASNVFSGYLAGYSNTSGRYNIFTGHEAGYSNTTGYNNQFEGLQSGRANTEGRDNVFSGWRSGYNNISGSFNLFQGTQSGYNNTTGGSNIFLGSNSGYGNTSGGGNLFVGSSSGFSNREGGGNLFVGTSSGYNNVSGSNNQFVGTRSGYSFTSGTNNVLSGYYSGNGLTSGSRNTFTGASSGERSTEGSDNVFSGYYSGFNTTGSNNVFSGSYSGYNSAVSVNEGSNNTFTGYGTGQDNTTGSNNTALGVNSGPKYGNGDISNATAIGANAATSQSNTVVLGNNADVGIGTSTPTQKLQVAGQVYSSTGGFRFPDNTVQTTAAVTATGANFVQNQTTEQAGANFNVSGAGTVGGQLTAGSAAINGATAVTGATTLRGQTNINTTGTAGTTIGSSTSTVTLPGLSTAGIVTNTAGGQLGTVPASSLGGNFILNQTTQQASSNFNISGNGYVAGRVGIGTTSPTTTLDVRTANNSAPAITVGTVGETGGGLYLGNPGHGVLRGYNGNGNSVGLYTTAGDVFLSANGSGQNNHFVLQNSGNVGIGTSEPTATLHVGGSGSSVRLEGLGDGASTRLVTVDASGNLVAAANLPAGTVGDTLGNHIATRGLTGTNGEDIGTVVGLGIRPDGGLNLAQNGVGHNLLLGYQAGRILLADETASTGIENQFIGYQAGQLTTVGSRNLFSGYQAGYANTTGTGNQFIGFQSGYSNTDGAGNLFSGYHSGYSNTLGNANHFVGTRSGYFNTTGSFNQFEGFNSGVSNTEGNNNVFSGFGSGLGNTLGSNNVFSGYLAGSANEEGTNNTAIGANSGPDISHKNIENATALGANVTLTQSNTVVLGDQANVGIGTSEPTQKLEVAGTVYSSTGGFQFPDGTTQTTAAAPFDLTGDITSVGVATTYNNVVPADKGGAGSVRGILKADGSGTVAAAQVADFPILNQSTTGNAATATYATTAGNAATVTTNANLTGAITSTGNATSYAAVVPATKGGAGSVSGLLKANGSGEVSAAVAGTDYLTPAAAGTGFIQNTTTQQTSSNFNISGAGTVGGQLTAGSATINGALQVSGATKLNSLAGSNARMVTAAADGTLGTQALPTDAQTLTVSSGSLSISGGNSVTLPDASATNELQTITKSGNTVTLSNGGGSFTDLDTDAQQLTLDDNTLRLSNSTSVVLPDASNTNEAQTIFKSNGVISLTSIGGFGGGSVTDTDGQLLSVGNGNLTISGGNSLALSSLGDNLGNHTATQNLQLTTANDLLLKDTNHGLGWYGAAKTWNNLTTDGPVLYGYDTGILGIKRGTTQQSVLYWNYLGRVGIGTTDPRQALDVEGGILARSSNAISRQGAYLQWNRSGGEGETWLLNQQGGGGQYAGVRFGKSDVNNAVTEWARFIDNGYLGLGTVTPDAKLDIESGDAQQLILTSTSTDPTGMLTLNFPATNSVSNTSSELIVFNKAGVGLIGAIGANLSGNTVYYNTASDRRLKENIRPTHYGLSDLLKLRVQDYNFIGTGAANRTTGFLAQDLFRVYPEAVSPGDSGTTVSRAWAVDYGKLTPLLVQAIQEQQAQIEELKKQNAALQAQAKTQEARATSAEAKATQATATLESFEQRLRRLEDSQAQAQK
ncbi:galactose-binding domain-containing protein [Hymenobacter guriensis]|uniref:Tail fiber domain-containing protein n=1 Tax=Hymenobacter guriensis TaxID=2793065 RepID=A0ABS0L5J3_9BACT|nr:tail fiber domain-containing protein [Hymenobacter guriensis]MBG8555406.1 tail fiber domain-containing protein [Hymenobacter guriensis]